MKAKMAGLIAFVVVAATLFCWVGVAIVEEAEKLEQERHTFSGEVTAIVHTGDFSRVWLNSDPQVISIRGNVALVVGAEYEIVINGKRELVNAQILGETGGEK